MSTESLDVEPVSATTALQELQASVRQLMKDYDQLRMRATNGEARIRELEGALRDVSSGGDGPVALNQRVHASEQETRFLARRVDRARDSVKRISARLQFLDEDR